MTKALAVADHFTAIRDLAKVVGMTAIHSGHGGRYVIFADDKYADAYLVGNAFGNPGVAVTVTFNERGEVSEAHKRVNGESRGDVRGTYGNAGQRLLWTLHLFSQRGL